MAADDDSGTHLYLVLLKAHRAMAAHASASIEAMDLGFSDFRILEALLHKGPLLVNDIGRRINLTSGSVTTAIDRLEKRKLVERSADVNDARAKVVTLTEKGHALIKRAFVAHRKNINAAAGSLSKAERRTFISLAKKLGLGAEAMFGSETKVSRPRSVRR